MGKMHMNLSADRTQAHYQKRDAATGRIMKLRKTTGKFKGIRKEK